MRPSIFEVPDDEGAINCSPLVFTCVSVDSTTRRLTFVCNSCNNPIPFVKSSWQEAYIRTILILDSFIIPCNVSSVKFGLI